MTLDAFIAIWTLHRRLAVALLFRCLVYGGAVGVVLSLSATGAGLGLLWGRLAGGGPLTTPGAVLGLLAGVAVLMLARGWLLYIVRAGHAALIVAVLDGAAVPSGRAQIAAGAGAVSARFGSARDLAALEHHVREVLRALGGLVQGVLLHVLPVPGLRRAHRLQRALLRQALGRMDMIVLAHVLRDPVSNPWHGARLALVLHAQAGRPMMIRAARMAALHAVATVCLFLLVLTPAEGLSNLMPGTWVGETLMLALLLTWAARSALLDPLVLSVLLRASLARTDPLRPNPDWEDKLDSASPAFHEMGRRAVAWKIGAGQKRPSSNAHRGGETQGG